jgi:hypothetical protein
MTNNTAILNCLTKQLYIRFEYKYFTIDLTEGDLEDNWNSIQFSDETTLDINFHWEDEPYVSLYGLIYDAKSDTYSTNTNEYYPIKISTIIGDKADYFDMEYQAEIGLNCYRVYSGCKMIKRTAYLNIASDFTAKARIVDKLKDVHLVAMDKYGATKVINIDEKYNTYYLSTNNTELNSKYKRTKFNIE